MTPPTVSRYGPGLQIDGLPGGPQYVSPPDVRLLLRGLQCVEILAPDEHGEGRPAGIAYPKDATTVRFRPGMTLEHGVYEAPLAALWRLFAGLEIFPVALSEVAA